MSTFNHASSKAVIVTSSRNGEQVTHVGVDGFHFDEAENLIITNGAKVAAIYAHRHWSSVFIQDVPNV